MPTVLQGMACSLAESSRSIHGSLKGLQQASSALHEDLQDCALHGAADLVQTAAEALALVSLPQAACFAHAQQLECAQRPLQALTRCQKPVSSCLRMLEHACPACSCRPDCGTCDCRPFHLTVSNLRIAQPSSARYRRSLFGQVADLHQDLHSSKQHLVSIEEGSARQCNQAHAGEPIASTQNPGVL